MVCKKTVLVTIHLYMHFKFGRWAPCLKLPWISVFELEKPAIHVFIARINSSKSSTQYVQCVELVTWEVSGLHGGRELNEHWTGEQGDTGGSRINQLSGRGLNNWNNRTIMFCSC